MEQAEITQPAPAKKTQTKFLIVCVCLVLVIALESAAIVLTFRENQSLRDEIRTLENHLGSSESSYASLKDNFDSCVAAYEDVRTKINLHSNHPTEEEQKLVTPDDADVVNIMTQATGGWSNTSDFGEYWDDMKSLYDWVTDNIVYAKDSTFPILPEEPSDGLMWRSDNWQFPNETIRIKQGDCEDQAILLVSLIRAYNSRRYNAYCILITGHAAVLFPVEGNKTCILDPAGHYTTNYGSPSYQLASRDIRQEVNDWLSRFESGTTVNGVFSDSKWKSFSGTGEFIDWMIEN